MKYPCKVYLGNGVFVEWEDEKGSTLTLTKEEVIDDRRTVNRITLTFEVYSALSQFIQQS